jgi:hypothetical protein
VYLSVVWEEGLTTGKQVVAIGDVWNEDKANRNDVVVGVTGAILVFVNSGQDDVEAWPRQAIPLGHHVDPTALAIGDFNNDGAQDLAVAATVKEPPGELHILLQEEGQLEHFADAMHKVGTDPTDIVAPDRDGDGYTDFLAVTNAGSDNVSIFDSWGTGTFRASRHSVAGIPRPQAIIELDDGSSEPSIAVACADSSVWILRQEIDNGDTDLEPNEASKPKVGLGPVDMIADRDLDSASGNEEILTADHDGRTLSLLKGIVYRVTEEPAVTDPVTYNPVGLAGGRFVPLEIDNLLNIAVVYEENRSGGLEIRLTHETGSEAGTGRWPLPALPNSIASGKLDGDIYDDIVIGLTDYEQVVIWSSTRYLDAAP